ncbi:uncharacterized protein BX663DRAFT_490582 [Cokeromyces recurvatus]|uniref:uncharacterized protein n=1 Tax=Cokeromyces recurvatus TaxID=90255 RepID=UPI00221EDFFA|nr:uncharacterized protein BX663DRAFT_490582 [Cokeromyces recurvatus]KAI7897753.1 hypothetical protein BX663DRAFT_490582 [Cokeromyces recurvatus]
MPLQSRQKGGNDQLTQENSDNECELPSSRWLSKDDAELLVSMCLPCNNAFYKLQQSLQTQKWNSLLKTTFTMPCLVLRYCFSAIDHIKTFYNINKPPLPTETIMDIIKIIQEVLDGTVLFFIRARTTVSQCIS